MTNPVGYEGEPLQLLDGRTVHVKYGMRGLMRLEDAFGSLAAVQTQISQDGTGAVFTPAMKLLACGLLHEHDGAGAPLSDPERLADLIAPERFQDAVSAAGRALQRAFPNAPQVGAAETAPEQPSRGESGTTSAPSSSDAPMMSGTG